MQIRKNPRKKTSIDFMTDKTAKKAFAGTTGFEILELRCNRYQFEIVTNKFKLNIDPNGIFVRGQLTFDVSVSKTSKSIRAYYVHPTPPTQPTQPLELTDDGLLKGNKG